MTATETREEREESLLEQLERHNRPLVVKTIKDGKLVEETIGDGVRLSIHDRAYQYLVEVEDDLDDYPDLKGFLLDLSTKSIARQIDLGEMFDLRKLIMDALRLKHRKLAAFIYGIFIRD